MKKYAEVCKSMQKHAKVYKSMQQYIKVQEQEIKVITSTCKRLLIKHFLVDYNILVCILSYCIQNALCSSCSLSGVNGFAYWHILEMFWTHFCQHKFMCAKEDFDLSYGSLHKEQGPTRHRPMAQPVVLRYLSYSTTLAEHAVHRLQRCPAFGRPGTCLFLSVQLDYQSRP